MNSFNSWFPYRSVAVSYVVWKELVPIVDSGLSCSFCSNCQTADYLSPFEKVVLQILFVKRSFADPFAVISVMFSYAVYRSKLKIEIILLFSIFPFTGNKDKNTFLNIFLILNRTFSSLGEGSYADQHCCYVCHLFKLILQIQLKGAIDYVFLSLFPSNKGETLLLVSLRFWVGLSLTLVKVLLQNISAVAFFMV